MKLKQLETYNLTYSDSLTTELFIQGLNNKTFGEAREKLLLNEELHGTYAVGETPYPTTWQIASNYFRLIKDNLPKEKRNNESAETALPPTIIALVANVELNPSVPNVKMIVIHLLI